ncbi:hypothetical protein DENSPDRAFT_879729 [Dentipellis sp. KUC8613]|nr:hypothetical protein DENSPDRAFT_879729 [Dentipellis sp. KUC8613]
MVPAQELPASYEFSHRPVSLPPISWARKFRGSQMVVVRGSEISLGATDTNRFDETAQVIIAKSGTGARLSQASRSTAPLSLVLLGSTSALSTVAPPGLPFL